MAYSRQLRTLSYNSGGRYGSRARSSSSPLEKVTGYACNLKDKVTSTSAGSVAVLGGGAAAIALAAYLGHDTLQLTSTNLHNFIPGDTSVENYAVSGLQSVNNSLDSARKGLEESYTSVLKSIGFGGSENTQQVESVKPPESVSDSAPVSSSAQSGAQTTSGVQIPTDPSDKQLWAFYHNHYSDAPTATCPNGEATAGYEAALRANHNSSSEAIDFLTKNNQIQPGDLELKASETYTAPVSQEPTSVQSAQVSGNSIISSLPSQTTASGSITNMFNTGLGGSNPFSSEISGDYLRQIKPNQ